MTTNPKIPTDGEYRGVPLHEGQSEARLVVVRRDIDRAHALQDLDQIVPFACNPGNAPEARVYARAKAIAVLDEAVDRRAARSRTTVWTRELIMASASGLDTLHWRSPWHYCSTLDSRNRPGEDPPVRRDVPLALR